MKILVLSFYPLILNGAKRSRTTIEALETKGFSHATNNTEVKKLKTAYFTFKRNDYLFIVFSIFYIGCSFTLGIYY